MTSIPPLRERRVIESGGEADHRHAGIKRPFARDVNGRRAGFRQAVSACGCEPIRDCRRDYRVHRHGLVMSSSRCYPSTNNGWASPEDARRNAMKLTTQQIDDFNREGWLFLPELFNSEEVALLAHE